MDLWMQVALAVVLAIPVFVLACALVTLIIWLLFMAGIYLMVKIDELMAGGK